jgi:hypothetical protein
MFVRKLRVEYLRDDAPTQSRPIAQPCPIAWIDNFAMRNFTNSAVFDDTLPTGDGRMEIGLRLPMDTLEQAMAEWFRKKGYLHEGDRLMVREISKSE